MISKKQKWLLGVVGVLVVGGLVAVVAGKPMINRAIILQARRKGVELSFEKSSLSWGRIVLHNSKLKPVGMSGVVATIDRTDILLSRLVPTQVELRGGHVDIANSAPRFLVDWTSWSKEYLASYRLPLQAGSLDIRWKEVGQPNPWMVMSNVGLVTKNQTGAIHFDKINTMGVPVDDVELQWKMLADNIDFSLLHQKKLLPVELKVQTQPLPAKAIINLKEIPIEELFRLFQVQSSVSGVAVSSQTELRFLPSGEIDGTMQMSLLGFKPKLPPALAQYPLGKLTEINSPIHINKERNLMTFQDVKLTTAGWNLHGPASISMTGASQALLEAKLMGGIACSSVANSAAVATLGSTLGGLLGGVAKATVKGSIGVQIVIKAPLHDLNQTTAVPSVNPACSLALPQ
jgi:hypothetical protein